MLLPGIDSTGVVLTQAGLGYRISKIISKWGQLWMGPSAWSQLIGLISDKADVNSALRGLELIYVPYRVSSSDFESPLVHDCL